MQLSLYFHLNGSQLVEMFISASVTVYATAHRMLLDVFIYIVFFYLLVIFSLSCSW